MMGLALNRVSLGVQLREFPVVPKLQLLLFLHKLHPGQASHNKCKHRADAGMPCTHVTVFLRLACKHTKTEGVGEATVTTTNPYIDTENPSLQDHASTILTSNLEKLLITTTHTATTPTITF